MNAALPRLSRRTLPGVTTAARPAYDPAGLTTGIVHLGIGAFHRAHQAAMTDAATDVADAGWGIAGVTQRSTDVVDRMRPQDCLFTVVTRNGGEQLDARVVGSVTSVLHAASQPEALLATLSAPTTRIISATVTEKGYAAALSSRTLITDSPLVAQDLADPRPHRSVVGQLVGGFARRADRGDPGVTVLCCDNVPRGGELLHDLCLQFLERWSSHRAAEVASWMSRHVRFPNTLVDRIVPGTTEADAHVLTQRLGYRDDALVTAERYGLWVIEDDFAAGHPQWPADEVRLVKDIQPWSDVKLRLLNGGHSLVSYVGLLDGRETVSEVMRVAWIRQLLDAWLDEAGRSLCELPEGLDLATYRDDVVSRFANDGIAYRLGKVAADGSLKLPTRVGSTASDLVAGGADARVSALTLATWLHYAEQPGTVLDDPNAARIDEALDACREPRALVERVYGSQGVAPLPAVLQDDFLDDVATALDTLRLRGVSAAAGLLA
ncbi:mannitol dehydrogenase family protein [Micromonospora sp. NPDC049580]|uniref:mannitol dehydrogenase family protein n=1 Tax=Micromonospora sp. NPDC049580 TaxID=3154832 RepID=UPI0034223289